MNNDKYDILRQYIDRSLNLNEKFPHEEWNLLQYATSISDTEAVTWLLSRRVEANCKDGSLAVPMTTPLMIAVKNGDIDILKLLLPKSNINFQDQFGFTALHYATFANNKEIVIYLLSNSASTLLESTSGSTALALAQSLEYHEIAEILSSRMIIEQDSTAENFRDWLSSIGAAEYFTKFIEAGYDLEFITNYGLKEEDLDCVGVPMTRLGLRRKIIALHRLDDFYQQERASGSDDEVGEDSEEEDDEAGGSEEGSRYSEARQSEYEDED